MNEFVIFLIPLILVLLYIFLGFFVKIFIDHKKGSMKKNNFFKKYNIDNTKIDTIYNSLDNVKNYHRIRKLTNNTILFMNEYNISLIMIKNYSGQIIKTSNDKTLILKSGLYDKIIENPEIEFNEIKIKLSQYLPNYKFNNYLIVGGTCVMNLNFNDLKIIRMDDYYYLINKVEVKKKYTKEQIDNLFDLLK